MKDRHVNSELDEGEDSASYIGAVCSPEVIAVEAVEAALCLKASLEGGIGFVTNFFLEGVWSICWILISELDILTLFN